ncbi:S8 family serine peptidase [Solirubrobacter soli]|uniref:S8 family serine peptidase n=1 Tax=Solirubrobacter soli TaxID=363832 RepID=UPI00040F9707|nr:S8 family serine peptidase [Solirubrobacter soli]
MAIVAVAVPSLAGTTVASAAPSAQARLSAVAKQAPARKVTAIVQFKAGLAEKKAKAIVRAHGGKVVSRVPLINGLAVQLPAKQAKALAAEPKVAGLTLNTRVHSTSIDASRLGTSYPKSVKADKLWQRGITGAGIGVAVIDTGVSGDAVDFKGADGGSRIVANVVTSPGAATAGDGFGHGTHVAGIIGGNSFNRSPRDPFYGKYVGVAPESNLVAIKASDDAGNATVLDVINGIAFAVDHKAQFNIRVLNLSLSADTPQSYKTDPLDAAVEYAWQKGIVVVAAAGNRGVAPDAVKYAPANDPFIISVGGLDETAGIGGKRADWSSTGTTQDGVSKPDVLAPGAHIVSVLAPSSAFLTLCPGCAIGGQYFKAGGTSMAAPVVAGAAALLLQARPTLTPDQVKALLTGTDKFVPGDKNGQIDVERAVFTQLNGVPVVNRYLQPNSLIDALNRTGDDISKWTRSSWSTATGALNAGWARSSWSCGGCTAVGGAIDPQRSSWSRSSWSSAGEDASSEAAEYAAAVAASEDTGTLDAPIPVDAVIPDDTATPDATPDATPEPTASTGTGEEVAP